MTLWTTLPLALLGGMATGMLYFGGLWATLRALPRSRQPRLLFWASWVARLALCLAAFRLALVPGPAHLFSAMAGFLAARTLLLSMSGRLFPTPRSTPRTTRGGSPA